MGDWAAPDSRALILEPLFPQQHPQLWAHAQHWAHKHHGGDPAPALRVSHGHRPQPSHVCLHSRAHTLPHPGDHPHQARYRGNSAQQHWGTLRWAPGAGWATLARTHL